MPQKRKSGRKKSAPIKIHVKKQTKGELVKKAKKSLKAGSIVRETTETPRPASSTSVYKATTAIPDFDWANDDSKSALFEQIYSDYLRVLEQAVSKQVSGFDADNLRWDVEFAVPGMKTPVLKRFRLSSLQHFLVGSYQYWQSYGLADRPDWSEDGLGGFNIKISLKMLTIVHGEQRGERILRVYE